MILGELILWILFYTWQIGSPLAIIIGLELSEDDYDVRKSDLLVIFGSVGLFIMIAWWIVVSIIFLAPLIETWWNMEL